MFQFAAIAQSIVAAALAATAAGGAVNAADLPTARDYTSSGWTAATRTVAAPGLGGSAPYQCMAGDFPEPATVWTAEVTGTDGAVATTHAMRFSSVAQARAFVTLAEEWRDTCGSAPFTYDAEVVSTPATNLTIRATDVARFWTTNVNRPSGNLHSLVVLVREGAKVSFTGVEGSWNAVEQLDPYALTRAAAKRLN